MTSPGTSYIVYTRLTCSRDSAADKPGLPRERAILNVACISSTTSIDASQDPSCSTSFAWLPCRTMLAPARCRLHPHPAQQLRPLWLGQRWAHCFIGVHCPNPPCTCRAAPKSCVNSTRRSLCERLGEGLEGLPPVRPPSRRPPPRRLSDVLLPRLAGWCSCVSRAPRTPPQLAH